VIFSQALYQRQYGEAISTLQALLDQKPDNIISGDLRARLGYLRGLSGDARHAAEILEQARTMLLAELARQPKSEWLPNLLAGTYCFLSDRETALKYAEKAIAMMPASKDAFSGPFYEETRMRIWAYFGDRDRAIREIARLLKVSYDAPLTPAILRLDPVFDKLRGDARFEALLKEGGTP
jgi:tetratricopeptide (TPR) repeat protein